MGFSDRKKFHLFEKQLKKHDNIKSYQAFFFGYYFLLAVTKSLVASVNRIRKHIHIKLIYFLVIYLYNINCKGFQIQKTLEGYYEYKKIFWYEYSSIVIECRASWLWCK